MQNKQQMPTTPIPTTTYVASFAELSRSSQNIPQRLRNTLRQASEGIGWFVAEWHTAFGDKTDNSDAHQTGIK
jgi:hypothetical protein